MSRAALVIFVSALTVGLILGLYLGWVVSPVEYVDTNPAALQPAYQDDYILMTATVYTQDGDLDAALRRLAALGYGDPGPAVQAAARRFIDAGRPEAEMRRLAALAQALGAASPDLQPFLP